MMLDWKSDNENGWWDAWHGPNHYFLVPDPDSREGYYAVYVTPCGFMQLLGWGPTLAYAQGLTDIWLDYTESQRLKEEAHDIL